MGKQYYQKVCLNGHQISAWYESPTNPNPPEYCEDCGEQLIVDCSTCSQPILGANDNHLILGYVYPVPNYCRHCSSPYPWTDMIFRTTEELVALDDELSNSDKNLIKEAIPDLLIETPRTKLAEAKFKKGFQAASSIVKDSLRNLLIDVVSETAKKAIFPD